MAASTPYDVADIRRKYIYTVLYTVSNGSTKFGYRYLGQFWGEIVRCAKTAAPRTNRSQPPVRH
jgi:hypothetical protein